MPSKIIYKKEKKCEGLGKVFYWLIGSHRNDDEVMKGLGFVPADANLEHDYSSQKAGT